MKMKCLYKSILRGDVVKPGQVLDLTPAEMEKDVVKRFFVKVEGEAASPAPAGAAVPAPNAAQKPVVVAGLTRDQAVMKLTQAGVKVKGNLSNEKLADLYNTTFANLAEATAEK